MAENTTYQSQANELSNKLWAIANDLRGNMDASKFKNYILGIIFYRYLSERTESYMNDLLRNDGMTYESAYADERFRPTVEKWSLNRLGYIIKPKYLYKNLIEQINRNDFSIEDLEKAISDLTGSTMGQASEQDFTGLFNDMKLQDPDLGDVVSERTELISRVMSRIADIDFMLEESQFDVLGTAYMILIGLFASDAGKKGGEFLLLRGRVNYVRHWQRLAWMKHGQLATVPAAPLPCC